MPERPPSRAAKPLSILAMMGLVLLVAVCYAALRRLDVWAAKFAWTVSLLAILAATVAAVLDRRRVFWAGFSVFSLGFLVFAVGFREPRSWSIYEELLRYAYHQIDKPTNRQGTPLSSVERVERWEAFMSVSYAILALLNGVVGGYVGMRLRPRDETTLPRGRES